MGSLALLYELTHGEGVDHIRGKALERPAQSFCADDPYQHVEQLPSPRLPSSWRFGASWRYRCIFSGHWKRLKACLDSV